MKILGIDSSPTSTGLVKFTLDEALEIINIEKLGFCSYEIPKKKSFDAPTYKDIVCYDKDRYDFFNRTLMISEHIFQFVSGCDYAIIEDYAFSGSGDMTQISEFCSVIKFFLLNQCTKIRLVSPLQNKQFATGSGVADKGDMYDAILSSEHLAKLDIEYLPKIPVHVRGKNVGLRNASGISPLSDIIDAFWLVKLLHEELQIRKGTKTLSDLIPKHAHVLSHTTKNNKLPLYKKEFIEKKIL
jgi:hypothetical protein